MSLFNQAQACRLLITLVLAAVNLPLYASPWVGPGDPKVRFALQSLADRGLLNRSVQSWPVNWGSVRNGAAADVRGYDGVAALSFSYLEFEKNQQAAPGLRTEARLSGVSDERVVRGFDQGSEAYSGASVDLQWMGDWLAVGLKPAYVHSPDDDEAFRLDGSYVAAIAGNWVIGAGAIDRWWGPGWQSSLILSSNARPVPGVWMSRNDARAPETSWLKWLGPWDFTMLAGQYEQERAIPEAKLLGMRFGFRPLQGLDVGLSRIIMFGGDGRPEDAGTLWNALIGRDNGQDGQANDPGNQLGSIDVRYGFSVGGHTVGLYVQMMGEDEAGAFPARKSWLGGVDWTSRLFRSDQQWFLEYTNTLADDFLGDAMPNVTYEHSQYRTGYRYRGQFMGSSFGGDAEVLTLGLFNFFDNGTSAHAKLSYADLNRDGNNRVFITDNDIFYATPSERQRLAIADLGVGTQCLQGWLDVYLQGVNQAVEYVSGQKDRWLVGASWTYRL